MGWQLSGDIGFRGDERTTAACITLQLENVFRCTVCLENTRNALLQPCGHTQLCRTCTNQSLDEHAVLPRVHAADGAVVTRVYLIHHTPRQAQA